MSGGAGAPVTLTTPYPAALIGRHGGADVYLAHEDVSGRHALLHAIGGRVFWTDLGSRSGVLRGGRTAASGWLGGGEFIEVGPFRVEAEVWPAGDAAAGEPDDPLLRWPPGLEPTPAVSLALSDRAGTTATWWMDRTLVVVGSAPPAKLRFGGRSVSRVHGCLLHTPEGVQVTDLAGREGIRVNGHAVGHALLRDGDVLDVGVFRAEVRYHDAPPGPEALRGPVRALPRPQAAPRPRAVAGRRDATGPVEPWDATPERTVSAGELQLVLQLFDLVIGAVKVDRMGEIRGELTRIRQLLERSRGADPGNGRVLSVNGTPPAQPANPGHSTPAPAPAAGPAAGADDLTLEAVHAQVCRRIAVLQAERQGFWQSLLARVVGR